MWVCESSRRRENKKMRDRLRELYCRFKRESKRERTGERKRDIETDRDRDRTHYDLLLRRIIFFFISYVVLGLLVLFTFLV